MEIVPFSKFNQKGFSLIGKLCMLNDYQQLQNHFNNFKIESKNLIVDLARLTFCTSQGLGIFITISNTLKKSGKLIKIYITAHFF